MPAIDISNYKPIQKKPVDKSGSFFDFMSKDFSFGQQKLKDKKKESFYHELGTLMRSGVDIKTALELTASSFSQAADVLLFTKIKQGVVAGEALSAVLQQQRQFGAYEYYSIRIGEETGRLGEVLQELAKFFKEKISQRKKITSALTYPILVLSTSFAAIFFMIKFVVPMFGDVFRRFGGKLPAITALIVDFSNWFDHSIVYLFIALFGIMVAYLMNRNKPWFIQYKTLVLLRIPLVGEILKKIYLARFANTMHLLISTNTPLIQALNMVEQMIAFYPIEQSLMQAKQDIMHGSSLSASLSSSTFYPVKFIQLIKIAEEVNKLDHFFAQLAEQYTEEVTHQTHTISSMLEPLIIIFLGLAVGVILIAMYLPMFQMSSSF